MHGHKNGSRRDRPGHLGRKPPIAPARLHRHPVALPDAQGFRILGVNFDEGIRVQLFDFFNPTGAGLGVPMAIEPAHGQHEGIGRIGWFRQPARVNRQKLGPPIGSMELPIGIQPLGGGWLQRVDRPVRRKRPLLGASGSEPIVTQTGHVARAASGQLHKFAIDLR